MSHRKDRNRDDSVLALTFNHQLDSRPSWFVQSLRVTKVTGLIDYRGSLCVSDRGPDGQRQYNITWTAEHLSGENWEVVGQPSFDSNQAVDFELRQLVQNKLKVMTREGTLSAAPIKQTYDDQPSPLAPSAPPPPASKFAVAVMKDGKGATPPAPPAPKPPAPSPPPNPPTPAAQKRCLKK